MAYVPSTKKKFKVNLNLSVRAHRVALAKFRTSASQPIIETDRYKKLEDKDRICLVCDAGEIESEIYFSMDYSYFKACSFIRNSFAFAGQFSVPSFFYSGQEHVHPHKLEVIEVILAAWVFVPFVVSQEKQSLAGLDLLRGVVNLHLHV